MNKLYINKQVKIEDNSVVINREPVFSLDKKEGFPAFAKSIYKKLELSYPKFYKMDALCKLGFLSSEMLLAGADKKNIASDEIAIICGNRSASLYTDFKYQKTISEIPSPAVFVYTLPNIVIGEICIRNNIKGEALFVVQDNFDATFICKYLKLLFEGYNTKMCITGWLEMDVHMQYKANLFLVSKDVSDFELNETNLK